MYPSLFVYAAGSQPEGHERKRTKERDRENIVEKKEGGGKKRVEEVKKERHTATKGKECR